MIVYTTHERFILFSTSKKSDKKNEIENIELKKKNYKEDRDRHLIYET